ncbi:hypothetical protein TNIN_470481 [Trichonephila inaurata madagascariensis]|uniref:Uncharacterized protein n=1 Tax=Trichonephila inaurata madagascariensis TaxID=2747483 RepID=A0A8X6X6D9_9ARAC|nr:hypothetical protein TNIN_470481 [Trichonephila inaurata madagascariensis]
MVLRHAVYLTAEAGAVLLIIAVLNSTVYAVRRINAVQWQVHAVVTVAVVLWEHVAEEKDVALVRNNVAMAGAARSPRDVEPALSPAMALRGFFRQH